jgi:uncharacterized cupin superfamily protein
MMRALFMDGLYRSKVMAAILDANPEEFRAARGINELCELLENKQGLVALFASTLPVAAATTTATQCGSSTDDGRQSQCYAHGHQLRWARAGSILVGEGADAEDAVEEHQGAEEVARRRRAPVTTVASAVTSNASVDAADAEGRLRCGAWTTTRRRTTTRVPRLAVSPLSTRLVTSAQY